MRLRVRMRHAASLRRTPSSSQASSGFLPVMGHRCQLCRTAGQAGSAGSAGRAQGTEAALAKAPCALPRRSRMTKTSELLPSAGSDVPTQLVGFLDPYQQKFKFARRPGHVESHAVRLHPHGSLRRRGRDLEASAAACPWLQAHHCPQPLKRLLTRQVPPSPRSG